MAFSLPTTLGTWCTHLAPWLRALQFKMRVETPWLPTRDEMSSFWISANYFVTKEYDAESWTAMLEAFELLDLLVRVDGDIGWGLLLAVTEVDHAFRINKALLFDPTCVRPQFALVLKDREMLYVQKAFEACCRMADVDHRPVRDRKFMAVERLLLDAWSEKHDGERFNRATHGRVRIKPVVRIGSLFSASKFERYMTAVAHARVRWSRMEDDERRLVTNPFVIPMVDVKLSSSDPWGINLMDSLLHVANCDIPTANLVHHPASRDDDRADTLLDKLLCRTAGQNSVRRLKVKTRKLTEGVIYALCKALALSRGLEEFVWSTSQWNHHPVDSHWPWLLFSLFRPGSSHGIRSVTLHVGGLEVGHVDAIHELANHPDSLPFLQSDGVEREDPLRSTIKDLRLEHVNQASRTAVVRLLQVVGASLEHLSLMNYRGDSYSEEFMVSVLRYCPRLKRLEMADMGMALGWLIASPGNLSRCQTLESLVLVGRMGHPTVETFFQVLEDKHHYVTKSLKHLHWSVWGSRHPPTAMVEAWLHMLEVNQHLEQSEIVMLGREMPLYERMRYHKRFEAHNGEILVDKRKLAFLSVLSPSNSSIPEMLELSTETIKLVMDFAWYPKRRICG